MGGEWLILLAGMCFGASLATAYCLIVLSGPPPMPRPRVRSGMRVRGGGLDVSGVPSSHWVSIQGIPPAAEDFERTKEG
jgi:hypothetical protein